MSPNSTNEFHVFFRKSWLPKVIFQIVSLSEQFLFCIRRHSKLRDSLIYFNKLLYCLGIDNNSIYICIPRIDHCCSRRVSKHSNRSSGA